MIHLKMVEEKIRFLLAFYFIIVIVVSLYGVFLQTKLFLLQRKLVADKDPSSISELTKVLDLMLFTGQIFRACGTVGISYGSIIAAAITIYCLPNVIPELKLFEYHKGNRCITYLIEPEEENIRADLRIDNFLQKVIESNINITTIVLGKLEECDLYFYFSKVCSLGRQFDKLDGKIDENYLQMFKNQYEQTSKQVGSLKVLRKRNESDNNIRYSRFTHSLISGEHQSVGHFSIAKLRFIASHRDQLQCLIRLKFRKNKIWPSSRNPQWADEMKLAWRLAFGFGVVILWSFAELVSYFGVKASFNLIQLSQFGPEYQRITLVDRIVSFNIYFISYFCVLMSLTPSLTLFVSFIDIFKQFNLVESKVNQFRFSLGELDNSNNKHDLKNNLVIEKFNPTKRDLHFECDKSAIELYICYLMFRDELRASLDIAQKAATQTVSFVVIVTIPMLPFIGYILKEDTGVLFTMIIGFFLIVDAGLIVCAMVNSYCQRLSRKIWNLIAYAERYNLDAYNLSLLFRSNGKMLLKLDDTILYNFDYEYHLHGFMTYHTMFLWRRLAVHDESISNHFICKLFGIFKVNYSSIIKYNYWFVSIALIILGTNLIV